MPTELALYNSFLPSKLKDNKFFIVLSIDFNYDIIAEISNYIKDINDKLKYFIYSKSLSNYIKDCTEIETDIIISGLFRIKEDYGITIISNFGSFEKELTKRLKSIDIVLVESFNSLNLDVVKTITSSQKPAIFEAKLLDKNDVYKIGSIAEKNKAPISFLFDDITIKYIDIYENFFSFLILENFDEKALKAALNLGFRGFFINISTINDVKNINKTIQKINKEPY